MEAETIDVPSKASDMPYWDFTQSKFIGLYERKKTLNVLKLMDMYPGKIYPKTLASSMTKLLEPPQPVITYCRRVIAIHKHPDLRKALEDDVISGREALSEIAPYTNNRRYAELTTRYLASKYLAKDHPEYMTNKSYRAFIKELKKSS